MDRLTRIAGSFAIVVVAYWMYALLAVRWIEPSADLHSGGAISDEQRASAADSNDLQIKQLQSLFPTGAWAAWGLKDPKIFESGQARLIFESYDNTRPDHSVEIKPCLIVYRYEGPAENEEQRLRQSIVLEAPSAVLKFDQPLSFTEFKIRRLEHGWLKGRVRIRSGWKEPGPEDDLLIETRDIELTEKVISTPHPVNFRWGPHYGRGRDMVIQLLAGPSKPGSQVTGANVSGIESFELRHIEQLHLDLGQTMASPAGKPGQQLTSVPVDIDCQGPFRFDVLHRVASFSDRVDVRKQNPSGPADQINCDLLSLYFTDRTNGKQAAAKPAKPGSLDLEAERIEARGNPVLVTAPSQKGGTVFARGQRLEYNLKANAIALDGGSEVSLQQGPNEIHAPSLYYKSAGPGRLGQMAAAGPGFLRGQSPDHPDQQLEARWAKELRVYPSDGKQVIAIRGGAELKFQGVGQLQADDVYFWLTELPPESGSSQPRLKPYRMLARNNVHMNSERVACKQVEELTVWFKEVPEGALVGVPGPQIPGSAGQGLGVSSPNQLPGQPTAPLSRFEISGRFLDAEVLLQKPEPTLSNLRIREDVRLAEAQTPQPGDAPLVILGDHLEAADLSDHGGTVTVTGQRAHLEGRGLGLTGTNIHLDRGANRLWMDGPGQMDLPVPKKIQSYGIMGPLRVIWQKNMIFDGRTATFTDAVVASTQQQQLTTQTMQVQLQQPVSFGQTSMREPPQVENISCQGGVQIESRSFNPQQQLVRHDRASHRSRHQRPQWRADRRTGPDQ